MVISTGLARRTAAISHTIAAILAERRFTSTITASLSEKQALAGNAASCPCLTNTAVAAIITAIVAARLAGTIRRTSWGAVIRTIGDCL